MDREKQRNVGVRGAYAPLPSDEFWHDATGIKQRCVCNAKRRV